MRRRYNVTATRWEHGWEFHIEGVGVTQSHNAYDDETVVRHYLHLMRIKEPFDVEILYENINPHVTVAPEVFDGITRHLDEEAEPETTSPGKDPGSSGAKPRK